MNCSIRPNDVSTQIEADRLIHRQKQQDITKALSRIIPPLFAKAHIRNLNPQFRARLLHYPKAGLVLFGPTGTGKSYALCSLARWLIIQKKENVKRIGYETLCLDIRDTYKGSGRSELDVVKPLINCSNLIIEDIGAGRGIGQAETDFNIRTLLVILDSRLEQCRPTFISTNKSKLNLTESFDERIASRLSMFEWIGVGGKDKRTNEKNN